LSCTAKQVELRSAVESLYRAAQVCDMRGVGASSSSSSSSGGSSLREDALDGLARALESIVKFVEDKDADRAGSEGRGWRAASKIPTFVTSSFATREQDGVTLEYMRRGNSISVPEISRLVGQWRYCDMPELYEVRQLLYPLLSLPYFSFFYLTPLLCAPRLSSLQGYLMDRRSQKMQSSEARREGGSGSQSSPSKRQTFAVKNSPEMSRKKVLVRGWQNDLKDAEDSLTSTEELIAALTTATKLPQDLFEKQVETARQDLLDEEERKKELKRKVKLLRGLLEEAQGGGGGGEEEEEEEVG
jgi:hypothetical protein